MELKIRIMSSRQGDGYKMDKERKVGFENYVINPYISGDRALP